MISRAFSAGASIVDWVLPVRVHVRAARRLAGRLVMVTALALTGSTVATGAAHATVAAATVTSYGPYQFKNDYSHLCMDVGNGSMANGGRIQQWDCYGGNPEKWRLDLVSSINGVSYYAFVNVNSGLCLDVPNGSRDAGVELQQWTCWSGDMQQWSLIRAGGSITIRNLGSGLCVDDKAWGGAGAPLQQWYCHNGAVQTWQFSR